MIGRLNVATIDEANAQAAQANSDMISAGVGADAANVPAPNLRPYSLHPDEPAVPGSTLVNNARQPFEDR